MQKLPCTFPFPSFLLLAISLFLRISLFLYCITFQTRKYFLSTLILYIFLIQELTSTFPFLFFLLLAIPLTLIILLFLVLITFQTHHHFISTVTRILSISLTEDSSSSLLYHFYPFYSCLLFLPRFFEPSVSSRHELSNTPTFILSTLLMQESAIVPSLLHSLYWRRTLKQSVLLLFFSSCSPSLPSWTPFKRGGSERREN